MPENLEASRLPGLVARGTALFSFPSPCHLTSHLRRLPSSHSSREIVTCREIASMFSSLFQIRQIRDARRRERVRRAMTNGVTVVNLRTLAAPWLLLGTALLVCFHTYYYCPVGRVLVHSTATPW